jgi:hypothetical protein
MVDDLIQSDDNESENPKYRYSSFNCIGLSQQTGGEEIIDNGEMTKFHDVHRI